MTTLPSLSIAGIAVHQDPHGRFSLNDLHRAAGGEKRHQPSDWLRIQQTQDLIAELAVPGIPGTEQNQPVMRIQGGDPERQGTYVVKELVYAYAMWISAKFCLLVIRTFDAVTQGQRPSAPALPALADPWAAPVGDFLAARLADTSSAQRRALFVPVREVFATALGIVETTIGDHMRLSLLVRGYGWRVTQVRRSGRRLRGYRPGPALLVSADPPRAPIPGPVATPAALPSPVDSLDNRAVRQAINRKAHALSMAAFERNVEILEDWLRKQPDLSDPDAAIARIHALELDHGQHVVVNVQTLWNVTSMVGAIEALVANWRTRVEALEVETGAKWYARPTAH